MPWCIPSARCPRCGAEVRPSALDAVSPGLLRADEDAAAFWPRGRADFPVGVRACVGCREDLHGLYDDHRRWDRELRAFAGN